MTIYNDVSPVIHSFVLQDFIIDILSFESDSLNVPGVEDARVHYGILETAKIMMGYLAGEAMLLINFNVFLYFFLELSKNIMTITSISLVSL